MSFPLRNIVPPAIAATVYIFLAFQGLWGHVGEADGRLYRSAAGCASSSPGQSTSKSCFYSEPTAALFPVLILGLGARTTGSLNPFFVRFCGVFMGLVALLLIWDLSRIKDRWLEGVVAMLGFIAGTPLVERARSGGVELWVLAILLLLARLLVSSWRSPWGSFGIIILSMLAFATHPYAGFALVFLLFLPMLTSGSETSFRSGGRLWFGWLNGSVLSASIGGLALFSILWPGFRSGRQLWARLVGLFREDHPPFRFGGEIWVQGFDLGAPPLLTTLSVMVASTSILLLFLVGAGLVRRDVEIRHSLKPLIVIWLGWFLVNSVQGSPFSDGYDHRVILLGLLIPFVGRGVHFLERSSATLFGGRHARVIAGLAVGIGLSGNYISVAQGHPPSISLRADDGAVVNAGASPFPRPVLTPAVLGAIQGLPAKTRLACSPWEIPCRKNMIEGVVALGFGPPGLKAARYFNSEVVIIPNDPTYVSPPTLIQDFRQENRKITDVFRGDWLRYALRRVQIGAPGAPVPSPDH